MGGEVAVANAWAVPQTISVTPSSTTTTTGPQTFTTVVRDTDSATYISQVNFIINYGVDGNSTAFYAYWNRSTGLCYLFNSDNAGAWAVQNWQAAPASLPWVTLNSCTVTSIGTDVTITWNVNFNTWVESNMHPYLYVADQFGQNSGWSASYGTINLVAPAKTISYLVVGGGGGGGVGGGGGGGVRTGLLGIATGTPYSVTVGAGGAASTGSYGSDGGNGGNSVFGSITSIGGGGAGGQRIDVFSPGLNGGSGGGGGWKIYNAVPYGSSAGSGTTTQGYSGAGSYSSAAGYYYYGSPYLYSCGGSGGGAGGAATACSYDEYTENSFVAGAGGPGVASSISGASVYYGGGGGGGGDINAPNGAGGGTSSYGGGGFSSTAGGPGVVIISIPTLDATCTGGTITTSGANTIHTFTSNGTFTCTTPPRNISATPTNASSTTYSSGPRTFTTVHNDPDGATNINYVHLLINSGVDGNNTAMYGLYVRSTNTCSLFNSDNAGAWTAQSWQAAPATLPTVTLDSCSAVASGNNLTVTWNMTFNTWIESNMHTYSYALDNSSLNSGWTGPFATFNVDTSITTRTFDASYLVVAGGGGPNASALSSPPPVSDSRVSGGGGGGGVISNSLTLSASTTYTVTVGAGGTIGNNGGNSSFAGSTAIGGGKGGYSGTAGSAGGSGGGGGTSAGGVGTAGQGNAGGGYWGGSACDSFTCQYAYAAGGGGGAGAIGQTAYGVANSYIVAGSGGSGIASSISGASVTYAGGGGGMASGVYGFMGSQTHGSGGAGGGGAYNQSGTANTGGGSGAISTVTGGSGVVIISYPTGTATCTGGTITTSGGNTIHTFTSSGSLSCHTPPTITSPTSSSIGTTAATLGATVTSSNGGAITARGTCYGTSTAPRGNCVAEGGTSVSSFTHARTGLTPGTLYYYAGYVTNSAGTLYTSDGTFTTQSVPTVTTPTSSSVSYTSATVGATFATNASSLTVTARGMCWGTSSSPTSCTASSATTTGVYTQSATSLSGGTLYYYRGYVTYTDARGTSGTAYSSDETFTTSTITAPSISSPTSSLIGTTMATLGATITSANGSAIISRGTCYSTVSGQATLALGVCATEGGTSVATFTYPRNDLSPGVLYYYQGYATNGSGTAYSGEATFTTQTLATVTSPTVTSVGSTTATLGATLTSPSITVTARGVCWGTTPAPWATCPSSGTATGVYTQSVVGLPFGTLIYYRGYATYTDGAGATLTTYSSDGTFTTLITTSLGNGTDPVGTTIAPGGLATFADAFTVQTEAGSNAATSLVVNLNSTTNASSISLIEITSNDGATVYGSSANPTNATTSITLNSSILTATTGLTEYRIRLTPKTHSNMPSVPGAAYVINAKIDSVASTNLFAGSDTGGTTLTIDNLSPTTTANSAVLPGYQQATVSYVGSEDSDLSSMLVLRSTSEVVAAPTEGATYSAGDIIGASTVACSSALISSATSSCTATGLSNSTPYYFKLFAKDARGNYSAGDVPTGSPATPGVVTILGTGTDPADATVAPGDSATTSGSFTFHTSSGSNAVTAVVVNVNSVANASGIALIEITSDDGTTVYGSSANPTNATTSVTLSTNTLTATTVPTQYKIRITPKSHANMPAVPGAAYVINAKIDSVSATNSVAGSDTGGTTLTIDNLSPTTTLNDAAISVISSDSQITLSYTTPFLTDLHSTLALRSSSAVVAVPTEGTTYLAGDTIGESTVACIDTTSSASTPSFCSATGLSNGTPYHFKLFAKDTSGNYSAGAVPAGSPATATTSASTIQQSGYRFFASSTQATPGAALAAQNTAILLVEDGDAFRLRMTFHTGVANLAQYGKLMKLQYAEKVGTCDAAFVGETYSDVTSSTPIAFYNSQGVNGNILLGSQADITHGADTVVDQTYLESNPFTNSQAAILIGQDGKWDFSLYENDAPANTSYCFRAVNADGSTLTSYSVIPEIATANQYVELASFRLRKDDGTDVSATYDSAENGSLSSAFLVGDKLRIRLVVSNTGSKTTRKSYRLEYSTSSCTLWTQVPRLVDTTSQHWRMETSQYVADNESTSHSTGLSVPNGKTFVPGKIQTFNSVTQPIQLLSGQYTEIEYSIRSTDITTTSIPYCFRLSAAGETSMITYSAVPQVTLRSRVFRYEGGGTVSAQSTNTGIEEPSSTATTTVTGGGASGGSASSTESGSTSTSTQSTSTPPVGGGGGDVGYLIGKNSFAYTPSGISQGMVLGESIESMCVNMSNRMLVGSEDATAQGEVSQLQYFLKVNGYFNGKVTGYFGNITENAVKKFQADNHLVVTGIAGKATRGKMRSVGCSGIGLLNMFPQLYPMYPSLWPSTFQFANKRKIL